MARSPQEASPQAANLDFDQDRLDDWLKRHISDYAGAFAAVRFSGGQSNPTYRLDTADATYVLRRKPFGPLLPTAHAVDREFHIIAALGKQGFPVPRALALCTDESVIGAEFYVMSFIEGRIFWDPLLPQLDKAERRPIYTDQIRTLARLHALAPTEIGLGDFGRAGNYFERQIKRWTTQYRNSEIEPIPEMERLIRWLPQTLPSQEHVALVHGDYRLDNMIFHPNESKVVAVLDWELATLGDAMADFSYLLMQWTMPEMDSADLDERGIPSMQEAIDLYREARGLASIPDLNWYFAYNLFRFAAIGQGIVARVRDGTAASNNPRATQAGIAELAKRAWSFADKAGA